MPPRLAGKAGGTSSKQEGRRRPLPEQSRNRVAKKKPDAKGGPKTRRRRVGRGKRRSGQCAVRASPGVSDAAELKEGMSCPICQDNYCAVKFPVVHAPCGHVACGPCSLTWQRRKSSRTCAMCRSPVLSIAHSTMMENLLVRPPEQAETEKAADAPRAGASSSSSCQVEAARAKTKEGLRELSQGDLNNIPGDYRAHLTRRATQRAVRKGDLTMLETCLRNLKIRASTRLTCSVAGTWKKEPRPVLSLLLAHGARLDGHCEDRPLLHAIYSGNVEMVRAMLEMKAQPGKTAGGESALQVAVRRGRSEAVQLLLEAGAPLDQADPAGRTPQNLAEVGWRLHVVSCHRQLCPRCKARWSIREQLAEAAQAARRAGQGQQRRPGSQAGDDSAEQSEQSDDSSSDWEESESEVSDLDDWDESDEEEDDDGDDDDDDDDDDDAEEPEEDDLEFL